MTVRVGITGRAGFIGSHLAYKLQLEAEKIELIPFHKDYFQDNAKLAEFVSRCDCIVHLAAMNRGEPDELFECNVGLVKTLVATLEAQAHTPHIIFSSSIQEEADSGAYGSSKREGRKLLEDWSEKTGGQFTGMSIENVFGAYGVPFYNSVVATFCYQLTHGQEPEIKIDAPLKLVYVDDLAEDICRIILGDDLSAASRRPVTVRNVSEILEALKGFRDSYIEKYIVPDLNSRFEVALFNSFRSYLDYDYFPVSLEVHSDERGWLFEVIKSNTGGQSFYSMTKPGITRGNHYHTRKVERFCVVQGEAIIRLRKLDTDKVIEYKVSGDNPCFVDIPIFHTHNITNVGQQELLTLFWCNEIYDANDSDTYFKEV